MLSGINSQFSDIAAVKIVRHSISQIVESSVNQSHSSLILDCEYSYDPGDVKLVVRWFYNDSPEPIYQWIPSSDNRYVGDSIRPYFDMDYRIDDGDDRFTKYRAIRLIPNLNGRPSLPVTLSGKYTCIISSIMSQDSRHGQLTIYVSPEKFEFNLFSNGGVQQEVQSNNDQSLGPLLRCVVESVYPKPFLTFSELASSSSGGSSGVTNQLKHHSTQQFHSFPSVEMTTEQNETTNLYSASFEYRLPIESIRVGTVYECKLELPSTNFVRKKRIKLIYPSTYNYPLGSYNTNHYYQQQKPHFYQENDRINWPKSPRISRLPGDYQAQLHKTSSANHVGLNQMMLSDNWFLY
ncbi:hypothetical protein BLOT_015124 [Blomia tropicalis]|nr:hypothetical protein BLOT_015124 [Blomia tropicalis]